jgi:hypothetical protein
MAKAENSEVFKIWIKLVNSIPNFKEIPRILKHSINLKQMLCFKLEYETKRSVSILLAFVKKVSLIDWERLLKQKKIKEKKQRVSSNSSLKTMTSRKHKAQNKKKKIAKEISNI